MVGRTIFAAVAALVLGAGFMMTPAMGKGGPKCGRLCQPVVAECRSSTCDSITAKRDKRACKKKCRSDAIAACNAGAKPHTIDQCGGGSPTAAFVN